MSKKIDHLFNQESLEELASYILLAANQSDIINDTTTTTDQSWSSKKVSDELDDVLDEVADGYVEKTQGPAYSGLYMRVNSDGNVVTSTMTMESQDINWQNEFNP